MRVFAGLLLTLFWALLWAAAALAQERITFYDVDIAVEPSGDIEVVETIELVSEGVEIRRGIFRELPAAYTFMGVRRPYEYELLEVLRDGQAEPVATIRQGNAVTWRIGRADRLLDPGPHRYTIRYRVADQIRRHRDRGDAFGDRDELWFNAVGTYWDFPIERARATVRFQDGAEVVDATVVTGNRRDERRDASVTVRGDTVVAETTRPLPARNGLNLSVSVAPGTIAALSAERRARLFWLRHGAVILLGLGGLALLLFYWRAWSRVGRDPARLPVFARYEPPLAKDGAPYSPAAVHYLHHKGFREMDALSSLLMQLGAQGVLDIEADKKRTTLRQVAPTPDAHDARILLGSILPNGGTRVLDGGTDTGFHLGVMNFHRLIAERYGPKYYRRNLLWAVGGVLLSAALAGIVLLSPVAKNSPLVLGLFGALALLNIVFAILLPAPTKRGAQVSSEIEGFKLYLETAEEDRLNMADPVSDHYQGRSPAMTVALYERFLPYAMALGVEKPWTKQFEDSLPREAAEYRPSYARGSALSGRRGPVGFSRALGKTLTAGVAAAAPVSQSSGSGFSSGSGGGGFSGGGGGGGGGGW